MKLVLSPDIQPPVYKEGELFKTLNIYGCCFNIYYGYYDDCERNNPSVDPMPIYPDFLQAPKYTAEGVPFVTKMQDACEHFYGKKTEYKECADCAYYSHGDDFIGICSCTKRHQNTKGGNNND